MNHWDGSFERDLVFHPKDFFLRATWDEVHHDVEVADTDPADDALPQGAGQMGLRRPGRRDEFWWKIQEESNKVYIPGFCQDT
jgi:hypothetical protein